MCARYCSLDDAISVVSQAVDIRVFVVNVKSKVHTFFLPDAAESDANEAPLLHHGGRERVGMRSHGVLDRVGTDFSHGLNLATISMSFFLNFIVHATLMLPSFLFLAPTFYICSTTKTHH